MTTPKKTIKRKLRAVPTGPAPLPAQRQRLTCAVTTTLQLEPEPHDGGYVVLLGGCEIGTIAAANVAGGWDWTGADTAHVSDADLDAVVDGIRALWAAHHP